MKIRRAVASAVALVLLAGAALGAEVPRSARMMKDSGNQFLAAKKYADAIDAYLQALQIYPDYADPHYNLGVAFLRGCKALNLARYHFQRYLDLSPHAADREEVSALVASLSERASTAPVAPRTVLQVVAGRLLVGGGDWVRTGDKIEVADTAKQPCASLIADFVYPDCVLTQRVWDEKTLEAIKPGLVAVNTSQ